MNETLSRELPTMTLLFWGGVFCAFSYDLFRLPRALLHGRFAAGVLDALWTTLCAALLLYLTYRGNGGALRWYVFFAAALGAGVYSAGVGGVFRGAMRKISIRLRKKCGKIHRKESD